ncbi:hypothetical protein B0A49_10856 [Cryomyces minteri]|uniref:Uncharacterized protein n=1 Tax=Cryomyces minteri TaxID=331657 RepID=A0A4U0WHZ0_9PEZI|nr:hypothetical protein B0A49_10856 [Cryomyces minteri]
MKVSLVYTVPKNSQHRIYELEQHYDFHDDMEFRHKRDKLRAGEPYDKDEERSSLEQPGIECIPMPGAGAESDYETGALAAVLKANSDKGVPRKDGDLIALSFISGEDLERLQAPRGFFEERPEYYYRIPQNLDPHNDPGSVSYHNGQLCVTEGYMITVSPNESDDKLPVERAAVADEKESSEATASPVEKTSRFRRVLGLGKKSEKVEKISTDGKFRLRRSSTLTELSSPIRQQADLDAAMHGFDIGTSGAEFKNELTGDRRASKRPKTPNKSGRLGKGPKPYGIAFQGHGIPGGMFISDKSKRTMFVTGTLVAEIYLCIVDNHEIGDLAGSTKQWKMAVSILRKTPQIDPDGNFELSFDAELYFFATLELSQAKFGRESSNGYNCINCLGVLYENLGRMGEAMAMYKRSIAGRAKIEGELYWDTAMSLQELATVYLKLEDFAAARPLYERSLRGFEHAEGPHHNYALFVVSNLSNVYQKLGMFVDLLGLLGRLIPRATETLGAEHIITGAAVRKYIECCGTVNLPHQVAQLVQGYKRSYQQTRSEVARWVLELC